MTTLPDKLLQYDGSTRHIVPFCNNREGDVMFNVNEHVFYSSVGVCRVMDIRSMKLGGSEEQKCYVLKPFKDSNSTIFVPVDNGELLRNMRPIMTRDEIEALIQDMPSEDTIWINNERERGTSYFQKARSCDSRETGEAGQDALP